MAEVKRDEFDEERERREYRRRRRIRNQVIAYVFAVLILAALVVGAVIGIRRLVAFVNDKKQEKELQEQMSRGDPFKDVSCSCADSLSLMDMSVCFSCTTPTCVYTPGV